MEFAVIVVLIVCSVIVVGSAAFGLYKAGAYFQGVVEGRKRAKYRKLPECSVKYAL